MIRRSRKQARAVLTCGEVGRVLQAHLDGELEPSEATAVADHLNGCAGCGMEAEVYSEIKSALRRQAFEIPSDTLARLRRFSERLADEGDAPVSHS